jgi:hypothetical protein
VCEDGLFIPGFVNLDKIFEVMVTVMPGSRLKNIMKLANKEISELRLDDFVTIWEGADDINKNES